MQSSKVLMPAAANADDDPQAAQVSPVSTDFWSAHGRVYSRGRTWPCMAQLTMTGTLAEAMTAADCDRPAATAGAEAALTATPVAAMPHSASAAAFRRVRGSRVVMEGYLSWGSRV